jgi:hypothetical protein
MGLPKEIRKSDEVRMSRPFLNPFRTPLRTWFDIFHFGVPGSTENISDITYQIAEVGLCVIPAKACIQSRTSDPVIWSCVGRFD